MKTADQPCCQHPVERHAYNGCANCGCSVQWLNHPDRNNDHSKSATDARLARIASLELELEEWKKRYHKLSDDYSAAMEGHDD